MASVADASFVIAAFAPDEAALDHRIFDRIAIGGIVVPAHWPFEICNAFAVGARRGRFAPGAIRLVGAALANYAIEIEPVDFARAAHAVTDLAASGGLTVYDAAYLELARRRALPLATLDRRLAAAAVSTGVTIVPHERL